MDVFKAVFTFVPEKLRKDIPAIEIMELIDAAKDFIIAISNLVRALTPDDKEVKALSEGKPLPNAPIQKGEVTPRDTVAEALAKAKSALAKQQDQLKAAEEAGDSAAVIKFNNKIKATQATIGQLEGK